MYVGGTNYNGAQTVCQIDVITKTCTVSDRGKVVIVPCTTCFYLKFEANKYAWVTKTPTTSANFKNAVQINIYSFGRGNPTGSPLKVDKVNRTSATMFYPINNAYSSLATYEYLINLLRPSA
jgi:hypothetical protein